MKIEVVSFSYKRGLPDDESGNGGGFVFDCRALPNPFWDEDLRYCIGSDSEVVEFFEEYKDQVDEFLGATMTLVNASIRQYLTDGRENLQVSFGCTGGQHRSVYCAEQFAQGLKAAYPAVEVCVTHAAKEYWKISD